MNGAVPSLMATGRCVKCVERGDSGYLREPYFYDERFDPTWGLEKEAEDVYRCAVCGTRFARAHSESSMYHDYDDYTFTRIAVPAATVIRLDQFLKLSFDVSTGGGAKILIQGGKVLVNGVVETRRKRQLKNGDVVKLGQQEKTVAL